VIAARGRCAAWLAAFAWTVGGCAKEPAALPGAAGRDATSGRQEGGAAPPAGSLPEGHPPIAGDEGSTGSMAPDVSGRMLKPEGIGSEAELERCLAKVEDPALRARFEQGFRACFTTMQSARDYVLAADAANEVLAKIPNFAPAYRVLAYARLNTGFDMQGATEMYQKAVAADPEYGEAHYGLAFMLTQTDRERGRTHFEKAMALGVPDERDLRTQFYPSGT
jgi:hypothetical protein